MLWRREDLAYCSNVHPGADLGTIEANIKGPIAAVRAHRGLSRMGCGLWLPAAVAAELVKRPERLDAKLRESGLFLFTLNGFPYGDFHRERVKEEVYSPAWDRPERLRYTLDLAGILAHCLPEEQPEGSISSVPLGFGPSWGPIRHQQALDNLCRLAEQLKTLREQTGRRIRLCLEPEPGCVVESTDQAIHLFCRDLPAAARRCGIATKSLNDHLGLCYDVCHQAVMFEDAGGSLARLRAAHIPIGKIQISSALEVLHPDNPSRDSVLAEFAEPRYLHQVRALAPDGKLRGTMDLEHAVAGNAPDLPRDRTWRIHFHVPIQTDDLVRGELGTTRGSILDVLGHLSADPRLHPHIEVETYTWQVLPRDRRPGTPTELVQGLAAELGWLEERMRERHLLADGDHEC